MRRILILVSPLLLGLLMSWAGGASAQTNQAGGTAETAPPELIEILSQIDQAASRGDVRDVMRFFSRDFKHSDGLSYRRLQEALTSFWERFPERNYRTELTAWQQEGDAIIAETTTTITGSRRQHARRMNLTATIASRQRYENGRIVAQEILQERSQVRSGDRPPTVEINLPEQASSGAEFNFDAIVIEPMGDRLLLGAAVEEPINSNSYVRTAPVNLELLSAGGLFKIGQLPEVNEDRWISAVLVREDGVTAVTQRLQVAEQNSSSSRR